MKLLCVLVVAFAVLGCQKSDSPEPTAATPAADAQASSGPAPIGSGMAGGMTPMTGTESVEGSGGGSVGFAAKDMARNAAGAASPPPPATDGEGE